MLTHSCMQVTCDENFKIGFNRVYDRNLANGLRKIYKNHEHLFEGLQDKGAYQLDLAANCKTIRDFDDAITRVSFGWPSVDAYYAGETPVSTVLNAVIIVLKPARSKSALYPGSNSYAMKDADAWSTLDACRATGP